MLQTRSRLAEDACFLSLGCYILIGLKPAAILERTHGDITTVCLEFVYQPEPMCGVSSYQHIGTHAESLLWLRQTEGVHWSPAPM